MDKEPYCVTFEKDKKADNKDTRNVYGILSISKCLFPID